MCGHCRRALSSIGVLRWFHEYQCVFGPSIEKNCMASGKGHSYETTVLVPERWSRLLRYHFLRPYSPDLYLLDLSVWNYVTVIMKKRQPCTIESLKLMVEDVLLSMSEDLARKVARDIRKKAVLCSLERREF